MSDIKKTESLDPSTSGKERLSPEALQDIKGGNAPQGIQLQDILNPGNNGFDCIMCGMLGWDPGN